MFGFIGRRSESRVKACFRMTERGGTKRFNTLRLCRGRPDHLKVVRPGAVGLKSALCPAVLIPFIVIGLCLSLFGCGEKDAASVPSTGTASVRIFPGDFDGLSDKPVMHVLIAASDTCGDTRLKKSYAEGRLTYSGAADRAEAMAEFLGRQCTGSLYSGVVIRTLINEEFTKARFQSAADELNAEMKTGDVCVIYFSAYSGIDKNNDFFIIPWDGKNGPHRKNINSDDLAKRVAAISPHKTLILADTNRGDLGGRISSAVKRLAVNLEGQPILIVQNNSTGILLTEFERDAGNERFVTISQFVPYFIYDFPVFDRWLDPGVLQISALFPGAVTVTGNSGRQEFFSLDATESISLQLPEDSYSIKIVYRNSREENRSAEVRNNSNTQISFTYRPSLNVRSFSGVLPAFGINIAELNPSGYKNIDQNVLGAMGMEQYRISFLAGEKFYQNGDYDKAITEFNRCLSLKANYADAYTARGSAYRKKGNYVRAIEDYSRALECGGARAEVYNYRGYTHAERGDTDKAISDFTQAIRLKRDYSDAYINRAHAYYDTGDFDRAIDDYSQVIRLEPRNASAWNRRGSARYRKNENENAMSDFSQAIAIQPDYAPAWHNRGNVWFNMGNYEKALADLNQAIKINPAPGAYISRGNIRMRLGDTAGAEADFAAARH